MLSLKPKLIRVVRKKMQVIFVTNFFHLNKNSKFTEKILQNDIERNEKELNNKWGLFAICI